MITVYIITHIIFSTFVFFVMININYTKEFAWNYDDKKILIWTIIITASIAGPIFLVIAIFNKIIKHVRSKNV